MTIPKVLNAIADVVLRYKPKAKSAPARKRQRKRRKNEKAARD
jgi:hypothetical protein